MIPQSNLPDNDLCRDFKGIWIPRELWECALKKKYLFLIMNSVYFSTPLPKRVWKLLLAMELADFSIENGFSFSKKFKQILSRGGSNV